MLQDIILLIFAQIISFKTYIAFRHVSKYNYRVSHKYVYTLPRIVCENLLAASAFLQFTARFDHIYTLDLSHMFVVNRDLGNLGNRVTRLFLHNTGLTSVSELGDCTIHYLDLNHTELDDASNLGRCHTLLMCYTYVSDVSMLGGCHTINLSATDVVDVSNLGGCHTLYLRETDVSDVSNLGNCNTLNLADTNVTDVSNLGNCSELRLSTDKITDVSMLQNCNIYCDSKPTWRTES